MPAGDVPSAEVGRASRRDEILAIAAGIFARQGIANTTVRDIGEQAGILSGSLYHHFTSKDDIVEEILRAALDPDIELDVALANSEVEPLEAVRELLVRSMRFSHDHPDVAAIVANSRHELLAAERFDFIRARGTAIRESWIAVLERGMAKGVFRADLEPDLAYKAVMGAVSALPNWYRPTGARSIDDIAEVFLRMFLCGMAAEPAAVRSAVVSRH
jgi:AcrR family transcriptional regulator